MHTLVIKPADGRKPREDEEITLYPLTDFPSLNVLVYEGCHWAPTSFFGVASGCSNTAIRTIKLHDMRFDDVPVEALVALGELAQLETLHLDGYLRGWPHCVVAQHEGNMEQMRHSLQAVVGKMATDIACNLFSSLKHLSLGGFDPGHYITDFFLSRCSRNLRTLEITGTLDLIPSATSVTMPFAFNDPRRVGSMMDRRPTGVDLINLERVKLGNVREVARLVKWLSPTPVRDLGITCTVSNSPTVSIELTMVNETIRGIEADWFDKRAGGFAELKRMQWTALPQENEFYFPAYLDLLGEDEQEEQERDRGRFHSLVQIGSNAREVLSQRLTEEGVAIEVVPLTDKRDAKKRWNATWDLDAQ